MRHKYKYIDAHTHSQFWNRAQFQRLDKRILLLSLDCHFDIPDDIEPKEREGAIFGYGLQPHTRFESKRFDAYMQNLESLIQKGAIKLLGELGLNTASDDEERVLYEQLKLIRQYGLKGIVHTPSMNKTNVYRKVLKLLENSGVHHEQIIIDHVNGELLDDFRVPFYIGLTIQQYGKLSFHECVSIVTSCDCHHDKFIVNSDFSNLSDRKQPSSDVNTVAYFADILSRQ